MEKGLEEYESNSGSSLPAWNGRKENMILKDGHYELTLDLSSCPQLKNANWQFPDKNWSFTQGPGENEITFLYSPFQFFHGLFLDIPVLLKTCQTAPEISLHHGIPGLIIIIS